MLSGTSMYLQSAVILLHARQADLQKTRNRRLYEADLYSVGEFQSFQNLQVHFFSFCIYSRASAVHLCCRLGDYMHIMAADQMEKKNSNCGVLCILGRKMTP